MVSQFSIGFREYIAVSVTTKIFCIVQEERKMDVEKTVETRVPKKRKKLRTILIIILCLLTIFILLGFYNELNVQYYSIEAKNIENNIRIALISDLHSCRYGENMSDLVDAINQQSPDIVVLVGDIFDDVIPDDNTECFLSQISDLYHCYYVTGNHEYWSGSTEFENKMKIIDERGITRLSGTSETVEINGEKINIAGVDDPDAYMLASVESPDDLKYTSVNENDVMASFDKQLASVRNDTDNGIYTVLLSHRPEQIQAYAEYRFELVLCGHAHGGQWRIPGIINGLFAPDQGLFPKYAGGKYVTEDTTMIVSRGLAKESTSVPRFYNRPEVVIIDIH